MERLVHGLALLLIRTLQSMPLTGVARLGRACGAAAYWLDTRHRRVALTNLARCLGDQKSPREIRAIAQEHFRRLGENYACAIKTAAMTWQELSPYVEFIRPDRIPAPTTNCIVAIGHFGNFELYARFGQVSPGFHCATTYRALRQPSLNRLLQAMRERSGCLYFERRTEANALKAALARGPILLGLLSDQHAGERGISAPFFGRACSTSPAPAIFALRYNCPLHTAICYRVGLARWQIEPGPAIPTRERGQPRPLEAITAEINATFEAAVRRDPANWFWVHNRWKPFRSRAAKAPSAGPVADRPPLPHG